MECNRVVVGVADLYISDDENDRIVTFSLGSCLGVTIYDQELKIGGILHAMLPSAKMDMTKAVERPEMFVDTGMTMMLQRFFDMGASRRNLIVKLAGCASVLNDNQFFKVGERNYLCAKKFLERNMLPVTSEDVHGTVSRTLSLHMGSGTTTIRSSGAETIL